MNADPLCKAVSPRASDASSGRRAPTREGVLRAAAGVAAVVPPTPLLELRVAGVPVFLKAESLQPVGAFKLRGAWHRLSALSPAERSRGVVAFSSGNHAQGVAWAARRLGMPATVVMPADAPRGKLENTRALGAEIVTYDRGAESREAIAATLAAERGAVLVPSFDDPWVIEGQGSAGVEAIAQLDRHPDRIVVPCGGGGLAAGLALACPDARIVTVEPEGWDDMARSLVAGRIVEVAPEAPPTACDALMTRRVSSLTFDVLRARGAEGVAVTEAEVETAVRFAYAQLRLVLEPGGAVALAGLLSGRVAPTDRTLVLLSGGNADPRWFGRVIAA